MKKKTGVALSLMIASGTVAGCKYMESGKPETESAIRNVEEAGRVMRINVQPVADALDPVTGGTSGVIALGISNLLTLIGATWRHLADKRSVANMQRAIQKIHSDYPGDTLALTTDVAAKAEIAKILGK